MRGAARYQGTGAIDKVRWITVYNDSGEDIPPYAVMEFRGGLDSDGHPKVHKPSENSQISYLCFNGPGTIRTGEAGNATVETPNWVAYVDDGSGSGSGSAFEYPQPRQVWGTEAGSWYLHYDQTGFVILGRLENDPVEEDGVYRVYVMMSPYSSSDEGSGSSSSHDFIECDPYTGQTRTTTFAFPAGSVIITSTPWA